MALGSLKCREVLARLAKHGIVQVRQRGSHIILLKPETLVGTKGPTYPLPCHNMGDDVNPHILRAVLRRFGIDEAEF